MAGLLSGIGTNPLIAMGTGLLGASGYSTMPISTGQALAQGFNNMQRAGLLGTQQQLLKLRVGEAERKAKQAEAAARSKAALERTIAGLPTHLQALARINPKAKEIGQHLAGTTGTGATFEGTSMEAQMYNKLLSLNEKAAAGEPLTVAEQHQLDLVTRHLTKPRVAGVHPLTGEPVMAPGVPLPGYPIGAGGGATTTPLPVSPPSLPPGALPPEAFPGAPAVDEVMGPQFGPGATAPPAPAPGPPILSGRPRPDLSGLPVSPSEMEKWGYRPGTAGVYDAKGIPKQTQAPPGGEERIERQMKYQAALEAAEEFMKLAEKNEGLVGPFEGRIEQYKIDKQLGGSEVGGELVQLSNSARSFLGTALSGVAIPIQEWPTYMGMIPQMADKKEVRQGKMRQFRRLVKSIERRAKALQGGTPENELPSLYTGEGESAEPVRRDWRELPP